MGKGARKKARREARQREENSLPAYYMPGTIWLMTKGIPGKPESVFVPRSSTIPAGKLVRLRARQLLGRGATEVIAVQSGREVERIR